MLHVRVAGQGDLALPAAYTGNRLAQFLYPARQVDCGITQVKAQCRQHLVIARAAEMQSRSGLSDIPGQSRLERRMHILVFEADTPLASSKACLECAKAVAYRRAVLVSDLPGCSKHLGVCDRAFDIVRHESCVEQMILAGCVAQYALGKRQTFFPEPGHDVGPPCSAGDRAAMSLTTSVPVPSFVNTSSNRLSGTL